MHGAGEGILDTLIRQEKTLGSKAWDYTSCHLFSICCRFVHVVQLSSTSLSYWALLARIVSGVKEVTHAAGSHSMLHDYRELQL